MVIMILNLLSNVYWAHSIHDLLGPLVIGQADILTSSSLLAIQEVVRK